MSEGKAANIEHHQQQETIGFDQQQQRSTEHHQHPLRQGESNHLNDGGDSVPFVRPSPDSDTTTSEVDGAVGTGIAATRTYQQQHFTTPDVRVYLKYLVGCIVQVASSPDSSGKQDDAANSWIVEIDKLIVKGAPHVYSSPPPLTLRSFVIGCLLEATQTQAQLVNENSKSNKAKSSKGAGVLLKALLDQIEKANSTDLGLLYSPLLASYNATHSSKSTSPDSLFSSVIHYWLPSTPSSTKQDLETRTRIESAQIAFGIAVLISASKDQNLTTDGVLAKSKRSLLDSAASFCREALSTFADPIERQPWFGSFIELHYLLQQRSKTSSVSSTNNNLGTEQSDILPTEVASAAMDRFGLPGSSNALSSSNNNNSMSSSNAGAAATNLSQQLSSSYDTMQVIKDLGPSCTGSAARFRSTLRQILPKGLMDEVCLAHLVYFFASQASYAGSVLDKEVSGIVVGTLLPKSVTDAEETEANSERTGDMPSGASALHVSTNGWNVDSVCQVLSEDYGTPRRDWELVACSMERIQGFRIRGAAQLEIFLDVFRRASGGMVFPPSVVVREWNSRNVEGQLSLLAAIATGSLQQGNASKNKGAASATSPSSADLYTFPLDDEEITDLQMLGQTQPPLHYTPWACGMFLNRLLLMMEYQELKTVVWKVLDQGVEKLAPMLICALVRLDKRLMASPNPEHARSSKFCKDVIGPMSFPLFQPSSGYSVDFISRMIRQLWSIDRLSVVKACQNHWNILQQKEPPVTRTLVLGAALHTIEIMRLIGPESERMFLYGGAPAVDANKPTTALAMNNGVGNDEFTITVTYLAADWGMTNLDSWLNDRITALGMTFLIKLLSYLQKHVESSTPRNPPNRPPDTFLSKENLFSTMSLLLNLDAATLNQALPTGVGIHSASVELSSTITVGDSINQVMELSVQVFPEFTSITGGGVGGAGGSGAGAASSNSDDIEEMANSYFQKIYTSENGINEVVDMLKKFKISGNQRENDIFACMIHNLFDEYRFFSKYPEKELRITGILFGKLIKEQLVSSITLGIALRYVLEALRKDPGAGGTNSATGKMFRFGMFALEQFKERLHEWPQYCSHIVQISHLKAGYQELVQEIDAASHASQAQQVQQQQFQQQQQLQPPQVQLQQHGMALEGGGGASIGASIVSGGTHSVSGTLTPMASAPNSPRTMPRSRAASDDSGVMKILPSNLPTTSDFLNNNTNINGNGNVTSNSNSHMNVIHNRSSSTGAVTTMTTGTNGSGGGASSIASTATSSTPFTIPIPIPSVFAPRREAVFGPGLGKSFHKHVSDVLPEAPTDKTADRVQFIINNLSLSNVEPKSRELVEVLPAKNFQWFASILVVKRISTQPNYHALYLTLLDNLGEYGKGLVDAILENVYLNIGKLLRSTKITTSTSERSLLKNLGSWLGQMTLRRNRPILQITLDCKELLYQGYETGRLIAVTPFVAKILEGAKNSFVFKPPNPWVMGLLGVFRALYDVDDLKMNIKFEVEVLCKNLGVKLEDIPSGAKRTLAMRIPPLKEKNPDFNVKSSSGGGSAATSSAGSSGGSVGGGVGASSSVALPPTAVAATPDRKVVPPTAPANIGGAASSIGSLVGAVSAMNGGDGQGGAATSAASAANTAAAVSSEQQQPIIPKLAEFVTINNQLYQLVTSLSPANLQRVVILAVDRAICEVIHPIIERSVSIACTTTKEIVTKDFAMEPDENRMRKAARLMVANLAGSLALVSCREALRSSLSNHLRVLLSQEMARSSSSAANANIGNSTASAVSQLTDQEKAAMEHCVVTCTSDNLELGCTLIEKAVTEKAIRDTDEALLAQFQIRAKQREETGQPYYDMTIFSPGNRYPAALPEPLRPKPGVGLRPDQLMVYEAFQTQPSARPPVGNATASSSASSSRQPTPTPPPQSQPLQEQTSGVRAPSPTTGPASGAQGWSLEALSSLATKLNHSVSTVLSANAPRASEITLSMLPPEHDIKQLLLAVQRYAAHARQNRPLSTTEQESVLGFAQSVFRRLYDLNLSEPLRLEALVALLEALNECCPQLGQDMGTWATYAPTETDAQRQHHLTILLLLVRSRLVPIQEVDELLSRNTDQGRNTKWLDFAVLFVRAAVLERIASSSDMPKTLSLLNTIVSESIASGGNNSNAVLQEYVKPIALILEEIQKTSGGGVGEASLSSAAGDSSKAPGPVPSSATAVERSLSPGPAVVASSPLPSSTVTASPMQHALTLATRRAAEATELLAKNDPLGSRQQVAILLEHWIRLNYEAPSSDKGLAQYLQLLQQNGIGKLDEQTERFIRYSTELVVEAVLQSASSSSSSADNKETTVAATTETGAPVLNYTVADSYSKLLIVLVRHMNNGGTPEEVGVQRIALLNKMLGITLRTMMSSYERHKQETAAAAAAATQITDSKAKPPSSSSWDQRPWFRILLNLVQDLSTPSPIFDPISFGISTVLGSAFHVVQPSAIPGFAFAWLELVSHRMFLSRLLLEENQKGWAIYHQLLIDLFLFLEPHLRNSELNDAMKTLHKGTLRVLLVLLHDFPSFLAGYHLSLCNVIPENCVQLRNLVLSAFPRYMVLPDPFTPNLKIDLLPEITQNPTLVSNVTGPLTSIRVDLDHYLENRSASSEFLSTLLPRLCREGSSSSAISTTGSIIAGDLDAPRVNSLVLYVGMQAIARLQDFASSKMAHTPEMEVFVKLMDLDEYGRYISLNAIANQLRFPSSHTHYFSCVMLYLFGEMKDDGVKEQITRVLLERLIVHRPHPWGLLVTFIELIKNQRYNFWSHSFVRCATEIEKVFESVARSCMTPGGGGGAVGAGPGAVAASQRVATTVGSPQ